MPCCDTGVADIFVIADREQQKLRKKHLLIIKTLPPFKIISMVFQKHDSRYCDTLVQF